MYKERFLTFSPTWCTPKLLIRLKMGLEGQIAELFGELEARSQLSALEGVEGRAEAPGLD
jgi:hypothetical protein